MVPSMHVEVSPEPEAKKKSRTETLVLEPRTPTGFSPESKPKKVSNKEEETFQSSLIEYNRMTSGSRLLNAVLSLLVNITIAAVPVLAGLFVTDTINLRQLQSTFLIAPPPPPPPPPAPTAVVVRAAPPRRVFESGGKLIAPTVIPRTIMEIKEAPLPSDVNAGGGIEGGVPGGVPGGSMGGVIGGVIGGVKTAIPLPPPAPREAKPTAPVRVGGRVKEPRLIYRVEPVYPALAKQVHTQGVVVIEAILDE
jgi:protein TonB